MEHAPDPGSAASGGLPAELGNAVSGPPAAAAESIERALASVGATDAALADAIEIDEAVLGALRRAAEPDAILEHVELTALERLARRWSGRLAEAGPMPSEALRRAAWDVLDLLRRSAVLRRIPADERESWAATILELVERSHLTVGPLLRMRAETYGSKPLFQASTFDGTRSYSWRQTAARVETLARGLLALLEKSDDPVVAILSENRIEVVWTDLACLVSGVTNVPIPANATETDVAFILNHCGAGTVVVSGGEQLRKIVKARESVPRLEHIVVIDAEAVDGSDMTTLDAVAALSSKVAPAELERRSLEVRIDDRATIMYSSGTTGTPKGIQFSQRNLIFKRFARALALPEIGDSDVFLCYLPLFHTFGRFFEMMGCIFWGATYCFLDSPSVEALIDLMRRFRPTVFISVPRKWIQLHEAITAIAHPDRASDEEILEATRDVTGGRLRWGLSAAGHLDSEIFRFFQLQGTELMSGFGMTEATGGISMTPPGGYRDNSLGAPLPGIECRLAEDGELVIRGPYVMIGYLDPPDGEVSFDDDGWFHTGDLMEQGPDCFLRLIDRKKEIYKNVKGETIAPQRIENLFRDFESVGRVFLVGDHRAYNTALIYPHLEYRKRNLEGLEPAAVKDHFRSLVVSVNKFLAPFERIVDFAIIDRDLDPDRGELTPKGTPRRKTVEANFTEVIQLLYRRTDFRVGGVELTVPNWLFQALGVTAQDIEVEDDRIRLRTSGATIVIRGEKDNRARIGSCVYQDRPGPAAFGDILTTPRLWLGNEQLVDFVGIDLRANVRPRTGEELQWVACVEPPTEIETLRQTLDDARNRPEHDLMDLHAAARAIHADEKTADKAVRLLETVLSEEEGPLAEPARLLLSRTAASPSIEVRRNAFQVLAQSEKDSRFPKVLERFLAAPGLLLDGETRGLLCERDLSDAKIVAIQQAAGAAALDETEDPAAGERTASLLRLLAEYGAAHPTQYRKLRAFLVQTLVAADRDDVREAAGAAADALRDGFRLWLGPPQRIAVDPETGHEYRWQDVVAFDTDVPDDDRRRLLAAIRGTSFLREAVFLFSKGTTVRLSDIPPGGVWIRHLGTSHGKSVYRVTVQTRHQESYDVALNVNRDLAPEDVQEEIQWLILCGESAGREPLLENFGGYWEEQDLWSEEFVPGQTLDLALRRLSRREHEAERFRLTWPFWAWSAMSAYVDFWNRTGMRQEISDPGTSSVIVPTHDYLTGARIVSVSARRPVSGLIPMVLAFRSRLVEPVESEYPALAGIVGWDVIFSSVLEVVGEDEGIKMFLGAIAEQGDDVPEEMRRALDHFLSGVEVRGFLPMRLFFAAKRYRRWSRLTGEPTPSARARTMQELWDTYGLRRLTHDYPESRVRFFRETVLHDAPEPLLEGLEEIIGKMRRREMVADDLVDAVADLRARMNLEADDDYFLARLPFPHLKPEDAAGYVQADLGGRHQSEMVVSVEDHEGNPFRIRHALNPKEVGRLHRLFLDVNLDIRFRPEHQYLVAISERGQLIGGVFYDVEPESDTAHLEKIVVANRYQRKGVASGLMNELFNRLRAAGVKTVTTGFYRPEYFYTYGFAIEKRYAGLVKNLDEES